LPKEYSTGDCLSLEELGQFARQRRKDAGHTQEEAAEELKLEQPNVSNAEQGDSSAKKTLFRLITKYTDFQVDDVPRYRLIEK
jgi:transcriptional regulator with XRE-family HTH domain